MGDTFDKAAKVLKTIADPAGFAGMFSSGGGGTIAAPEPPAAPPAPPPPAAQPDPGDPVFQARKRRAAAGRVARSGRLSTILSDSEETFG